MTTAQEQEQLSQFERQLRQAEGEGDLEASPPLSLTERALIQYGALLRFSFLAIDDVDQETHILRRSEARLFGRINVDDAHEFFGRLSYDYYDFNSGDDFDGRGDRNVDPLADRWWYRFDLRNAVAATEGRRIDWNWQLQAGRQYVDWASGLVLSDELYAARSTLEIAPFELEGLAALTPSSTFLDFDASRPDFDRDTERAFFGGKLTFTGFGNHRPYVYALHQEDMNGNESANLGPFNAFPTRFDYDSTYIGVGSTGLLLPRLQYGAEFIYQFGDGLSSSMDPDTLNPTPQTREDIEAWAVDARLSYLFRDANRSQIDFQTIVASGDDDRLLDTSNTFGGNAPGTDDNAFNAFGLAKTGFAFAAPISNIIVNRLGASAFPFPSERGLRNVRVGADLYLFNKPDADAPLDERTSDDHYLGTEADVFVDWRVTSDVSWNFRYGVFVPGRAIEADNDPRHFLYTGITYAF
ncbi:MAG: alginate export family protein [Phycisphaeraceae bacterium]